MEVGAVPAVGGLSSLTHGQAAANATQQTPVSPAATATQSPDQDQGVIVTLSPIAAILAGSAEAP